MKNALAKFTVYETINTHVSTHLMLQHETSFVLLTRSTTVDSANPTKAYWCIMYYYMQTYKYKLSHTLIFRVLPKMITSIVQWKINYQVNFHLGRSRGQHTKPNTTYSVINSCHLTMMWSKWSRMAYFPILMQLFKCASKFRS